MDPILVILQACIGVYRILASLIVLCPCQVAFTFVHSDWGPSINYVNRILRIFFVPPLLVHILTTQAYVVMLTFGWQPPPPALTFQRSLWMSPGATITSVLILQTKTIVLQKKNQGRHIKTYRFTSLHVSLEIHDFRSLATQEWSPILVPDSQDLSLSRVKFK